LCSFGLDGGQDGQYLYYKISMNCVSSVGKIHVLVIHHHLNVLSLMFIGTELPDDILILVLALVLT
jgi:hypothetical protein